MQLGPTGSWLSQSDGMRLIARSRYLSATFHVQPIGFANLSDLFPQLYDAIFDGILHHDRLAEQRVALPPVDAKKPALRRSTVVNRRLHSLRIEVTPVNECSGDISTVTISFSF
jgi:hypothetical protein